MNAILSMLDSAAQEAGITVSCEGKTALLQHPLRALLVSRNTTPPSPDAAWVRALCDEATRAVRAGETLVTGTDRVAYELPLLVSAEHGAPVVVLRKENEPLAVPMPSGSLEIVLRGTVSDPVRDTLLGCVAKSATRIAVRSGGNMAAIAESIAQRGGAVSTVELPEDDSTLRERWTRKTLTRAFEPWPYLTHYTREADGAWPGESQYDYLNWLRNDASPARASFATLLRILRERRLRAAGRFIRGGTPVTCWTELPPDRVASLRGWRRGLRRWNFTPYGIAVPRATLETLGARPVRYDSDDADPFTQAPRSGSYDWTAEREWRVVGDVDLSCLPDTETIVLTAMADEAEEIKREFGVKALATG
jgi:hypothetical protein